MTSDTSTLTAVKTAAHAPKTVRRNRKVVSAVANLVKKPARIVDLLKKRANVTSSLSVTYGNDPEVFVARASDGHIISSIGILKQDKHNPIDLGDGIKTYSDSALMEVAFPPYATKGEMLTRFKTVLTRMAAHLGSDYRLVAKAAHTFGEGELEVLHNISPFEVGCSPSVDIYTESIRTPEPFTNHMRSGSLHFHIGNKDYDRENDGRLLSFKSRHEAMRLFDIFVGCGSVILDKDPSAVVRRQKYGLCGDMRMTPFGLEARVLGNFAMRSPKLMDLTFDLVEHAVSFIKTNKAQEIIELVDAAQVQKAVNTCDVQLAETILTKAELPSCLMARVKADYQDPQMYAEWGL